MLWLNSSDLAYYENTKLITSMKEYKHVEEIIILPTDDQIKHSFEKGKKTAFLVSRNMKPKKEYRSFFVVKKLPNTKGVLTKQEVDNNVTPAEALMNNLGLKVIDSTLTLDDMSDFEGYVNWSNSVYSLMEEGIKIKPVLFLGLPGTGKSRGVASFAGEFNIPMVELNLTLVMESPDPIQYLNDIFEYLDETQMKCILRIDEIEQMIKEPALIGEMLTILGELQTPEGYNINGVLFATANDISKLYDDYPQFFRHGRWDEKFFVGSPDEKTSIGIMDYYSNMYSVRIEELNNEDENEKYSRKELLGLVYSDINSEYKDSNIEHISKRCMYVPSELNYLIKQISIASKSTLLTFDIIQAEIRNVIPQQITASKGIKKMYTLSKELKFKELY